MQNVRIYEMPDCKMVSSGITMFGEEQMDKFMAWHETQPRGIFPDDFLTFDSRGEAAAACGSIMARDALCGIIKEETEAYISLPDGSTHKVTASAPSFKWTVPDNFIDGMEITGTSHYETDDAEYKESGLIKLIAIDN